MSSQYEVKSVTKAITIITALTGNGFKGMSREQLAEKADITNAAAFRMLKTLEGHGWVRYSDRTKLWSLDTVWAKFSLAYYRAVVQRHNEVNEEYFRMTGEEFNNAEVR